MSEIDTLVSGLKLFKFDLQDLGGRIKKIQIYNQCSGAQNLSADTQLIWLTVDFTVTINLIKPIL